MELGPDPHPPVSIADANTYCGQQGAFKFKKFLGSGGFGAVYEAISTSINESVAIKLIPIESTRMYTAVKEAKILFKLDDVQRVVRYYHSYYYTIESTGSAGFAIVTDYCTRGDLQKYLEQLQHPLEIEVWLKWYQELADAVSYIHRKNICHRDLKPKNILVNDNESLKICDVGVAEAAWDMQATPGNCKPSMGLNHYMTSVVGTREYMAPEVWEKRCTKKCDTFSLGLVFIMIAESPAIGKVPTTKQEKPLGVALMSSFEFHPCSMISPSCQYAEKAEIEIFNKMLQFDPNSRPDVATVYNEVQQTIRTFKLVQSLANNFDTAIKGVIEFADEKGPYIMSMDKFYHDVASATANSEKYLKSIGLMPELHLGGSITSVNAAITKANESVLKVEAIPGGGDDRIDHVIESCKQDPPNYGEVNRLFDVTKLKASFQEMSNKCDNAGKACASAAKTCENMTDNFTGGCGSVLCLSLSCFFSYMFVGVIVILILGKGAEGIGNLVGLAVSVIVTCCLYYQIKKYKDSETKFRNCKDEFDLLKQSSEKILKTLTRTNKLEEIKRCNRAMQPHTYKFRHYISEHTTESLTKLKEGYKKSHTFLQTSREAVRKST